ncbi:MAG: hypothetical protein A2Z75_06615 [Chloroflexi bacterium RBG_13_50_10]|nr:MAG: hypothetical protein A2Z75_06615 [Chloroflexi bacterium RBG_13_50_10]
MEQFWKCGACQWIRKSLGHVLPLILSRQTVVTRGKSEMLTIVWSYAASKCTAIPDNEMVAGASKASSSSASATIAVMMTGVLNE